MFCDYRNDTLLCFNGTHLTLMEFVPAKDAINPLFKKSTKISLCPTPPAATDFTSINANRSGSKVALVSRRSVCVVHMSEELWSYKSLVSLRQADSWQPEYFAECDLLHMRLLMDRSPPTVVKVVWYSDSPTTQSKHNILGVLYSDNVIRIYDVNESLAAPVTTVDLSSMIVGSDDRLETSVNGTRLGFVSAVVSFDFGPTVTLAGTVLPTVLAVDSDGECYSSVVSLDGAHISEPTICNIAGGESRGVAEEPVDLAVVPHSNDEHFTVLALAYENRVMHVILIPADETSEKTGDRNLFDAFLFETLQFSIRSSILKLQKIPHLFASVADWANYLVVESKDVYAVDISQCAAVACVQNMGATTSTGGSTVRHIFTTPDDANKENRPPPTALTDHAVKSVAVINAGYESNEEMAMVTLLTTGGAFVANVIRPQQSIATKVSSDSVERRSAAAAAPAASASLMANQVQQLLGPPHNIPKVPFQTLRRDQQLMFSANAVGGLTNRVARDSVAADFVIKRYHHNLMRCVHVGAFRARELAMQYGAAEQVRIAYCAQLTTIHEQLGQTKSEMAKKRKRLETLMERFERVARVLEPQMFPVTSAEEEAAERLKDMLKKLQSFAKETNKIGADVCAYRHRVLGPVKPFQASADAQKFMLSKK
ncbi:hypothetical protein AAVH_10557 [Aphelenchoides avenae]|nr:hypothetical protein AAVH_10557 [Aphelenchus avenae]